MSCFRTKKVNFSQIPNSVLRDKNLSRKAKGLYCEIYSYITIPDFKLKKSFLMANGEEKEKAFESMWRELKEKGYLKQYRISTIKDGKVTFKYEYELLDEADPETPYLINIKLDGTIGETQGGNEEKEEEEKEENTPQNVPPSFSTGCNEYPVQTGSDINNTNINNTNLNNTNNFYSKKESIKKENPKQEVCNDNKLNAILATSKKIIDYINRTYKTQYKKSDLLEQRVKARLENGENPEKIYDTLTEHAPWIFTLMKMEHPA